MKLDGSQVGLPYSPAIAQMNLSSKNLCLSLNEVYFFRTSYFLCTSTVLCYCFEPDCYFIVSTGKNKIVSTVAPVCWSVFAHQV